MIWQNFAGRSNLKENQQLIRISALFLLYGADSALAPRSKEDPPLPLAVLINQSGLCDNRLKYKS